MSTAYFNGEFLPREELRLPVWDRGFLQGATVTERLRTFHHQPFLLEEHLDRLDRSLAATRIGIPETREQVLDALQEVVLRESVETSLKLDFGIVIFATPGPTASDAERQGLPPRATLAIHTVPLPFERWNREFVEGQRLVIPGVRQMPADVVSPAIKNRSRLHWHLADALAHDIDPLASALLLDHAGRLTETSTGNLFLVEGDILLTPGPEGTLPGISQAYLREMARSMGIESRCASLTEADLSGAAEVLLSSSGYCLMPVTAVDGRPIGSGRPGPMFERLISEWSQRVGVDIRRQGP